MILVLSNFPQMIFIFLGMGRYYYILYKSIRPARKESMRNARGLHAPITNLAKITFTGNSVLRAFGYESTYFHKHLDMCHKEILMD
jgi:hypothetical protein